MHKINKLYKRTNRVFLWVFFVVFRSPVDGWEAGDLELFRRIVGGGIHFRNHYLIVVFHLQPAVNVIVP